MKNILLILFFFVLSGCTAQDCKDLPMVFDNYSEAKRVVEASSFQYSDKLSRIDSEWISWAEFHSCDGKTGYFLYGTKKGSHYIHEGVPISKWEYFKQADSKGSYYSKNIKGRYQLETRSGPE